jgi:uncharacterized protein (UPF0332 family)
MINIPEDKLELTQKWIARAHESLDVAHMLYQSGGDNASIVNFAFYAMLYAVFALLTPYDVEKGVDKDHIAIAFFDEKFINSNIFSKDLSEKFHSADDLRQAHDFQPFFQISRAQAIETLNSAEKILNIIEQKLSNQL